MLSPVRRISTLAACFLLTLSACGGRGSEAPARNVLLIVVDTLRADHLGLYGHDRETSPALERLAERGYVFERAWSQAACTFPSVNSLLTSRSSDHFLGQPERGMSIPEGIPSVAEILQDRGFATAAMSSSIVVRDTPSRVNRHGGFGRGFERFDEECLSRPASCVNGKAMGWMASTTEPFFLYLHYIDPHGPYRPPVHHVRQFADADYRHEFIARGDPIPLIEMIYRDGPTVHLTPGDREQLEIVYDEEIRYFDRELERLMSWMEERGLLEDTLVVLASDHGEELLDHGEIGHCRDMAYETVLSTPLVFWVPGAEGGRRGALTQNLDIVPTVLDYLGVPAGDGMEGKSLRSVIEGGGTLHRYVFASQGRLRAVTDGRLKLVYDLREESSVLYDLAADPDESRDLSAARPETAQRLEGVLLRWLESLKNGPAPGDLLEAGEELEEELRAVGYL